jgi:nucleotide-binding universal stress UspA family protein
MKHILVPTDFSSCAGNALNFAIQLSKIIPAEISVFHSFEIKGSLYSDYLGVNKEFNRSQLNEAEKKLKAIKNNVKKKDGIDIATFVSEYELHKTIVRSIDDKHIDLIIMGTLGAGVVKGIFMGSRTAKVIGKVKIPVIAVPGDYIWRKPEKVIFTTNRFEEDPAILNFLFEFADLLMAKVEVAVYTDEQQDKAVTALEHSKKMPQYEKMLRDRYYENTLVASRLYGKDFRETLEDYIRENEIDLLMMATYKKGFWERIYHTSLTKKISYHTHIPLIAFPVKARK